MNILFTRKTSTDGITAQTHKNPRYNAIDKLHDNFLS